MFIIKKYTKKAETYKLDSAFSCFLVSLSYSFEMNESWIASIVNKATIISLCRYGIEGV